MFILPCWFRGMAVFSESLKLITICGYFLTDWMSITWDLVSFLCLIFGLWVSLVNIVSAEESQVSSAGSEWLSSLCVCDASLYSIPWVYFRCCISSLFWLRFPNDHIKLCQNITELNVTLIYYKTTCFADFRLNTWVMHCVSGSVFELSPWHYRILQDLWYYWKISQNTDHNLMVQGQVCYIQRNHFSSMT